VDLDGNKNLRQKKNSKIQSMNKNDHDDKMKKGEKISGDNKNITKSSKKHENLNQGSTNPMTVKDQNLKKGSEKNFHNEDNVLNQNGDLCDDIPKETLFADLDARPMQYDANIKIHQNEEAPMAYNDAEFWKTA